MLNTRPRSTPSPLQPVYRAKFALVAVVSAFLGIALIALGHWATVDPSGGWLRAWPMSEIGLGLFSTGLFGVLFHYVGQRDAEEEQIRRLRQVIADELAGRPDGLVAMVSSETRDRIAESCLRLQLGDDALAHDLYTDLREQIIRLPEWRYDMDVSVALAPWPDGPQSGMGSMFVATIRTEYRVMPIGAVVRFACVSDVDEYRDCLRDPSYTVIHYFEPIRALDLDAASAEAFALVELAVDGRPRPVRRTTRPGTQICTATVANDATTADRAATISFTYRALLQQYGHLFHLDFSRPTKDVKVHFAYGGAGSATSTSWTTSRAAGRRGCRACPRRDRRPASRCASTAGSCPRRASGSSGYSSPNWPPPRPTAGPLGLRTLGRDSRWAGAPRGLHAGQFRLVTHRVDARNARWSGVRSLARRGASPRE